MGSLKCPACGHVIELTKDTPGFDEWYAAYPRKEAKGDARKAYATACAKVGPEILLIGVKAYAASRKGHDKTYTKLPATWLRAECWTDEQLTTAPSVNVINSNSKQPSQEELHPSWNSYAERVSALISGPRFDVWFGKSRLIVERNIIQIVVDTPFKQEWIQKNYSRELFKVLGHFEVIVRKS